jgi:hypothetical protein
LETSNTIEGNGASISLLVGLSQGSGRPAVEVPKFIKNPLTTVLSSIAFILDGLPKAENLVSGTSTINVRSGRKPTI